MSKLNRLIEMLSQKGNIQEDSIPESCLKAVDLAKKELTESDFTDDFMLAGLGQALSAVALKPGTNEATIAAWKTAFPLSSQRKYYLSTLGEKKAGKVVTKKVEELEKRDTPESLREKFAGQVEIPTLLRLYDSLIKLSDEIPDRKKDILKLARSIILPDQQKLIDKFLAEEKAFENIKSFLLSKGFSTVEVYSPENRILRATLGTPTGTENMQTRDTEIKKYFRELFAQPVGMDVSLKILQEKGEKARFTFRKISGDAVIVRDAVVESLGSITFAEYFFYIPEKFEIPKE